MVLSLLKVIMVLILIIIPITPVSVGIPDDIVEDILLMAVDIIEGAEDALIAHNVLAKLDDFSIC